MNKSDVSSPVVIVGTSHSGVAAASELRTAGYQGDIVLVGKETVLPYHRPHLSKESLAGEMPAPRPIRPASFYDDNAITLRQATRVSRIDRDAKSIVLSDGSRLVYGTLILATGARARRLPAELAGADRAVVLREHTDWQTLATELNGISSLAVIGGGLIGLEVAAAARVRGLSVSVIEAGAGLMARSIYPELASRVCDHHRTQGIDIRLNETVAGITETGITLADGDTINADRILASVGSVPRTELAETSGLACSNGIDVDASGRTVDPSIYALGDCAHWDHQGVAERHENVAATQFQAKVIAAALTGQSIPERTALRLWSYQGALRLMMSGPVLADAYTDIEEVEGGGTVLRAFHNDRLIAVQAMNAPRPFNAAVGQLGQHRKDTERA